jgi:signal transduction histidine kinase
MDGLVPARARRVAMAAGHGWREALLAGAAPLWWWRAPWQRRAAFGLLVIATLAACAASLACLPGITVLPHNPQTAFVAVRLASSRHFVESNWLLTPSASMAAAILIALAIALPLALAARYPLLGWRLAWLGMILVPLVHLNWWGGWPWDPVQILVLAVVFAIGGMRHSRAAVWWMWTLSVLTWWLWAGDQRPGTVASVLGTVAFTAVAVAVDSLGSRQRAQQAFEDQSDRTELERARRAVLEERARIARELHDVVAHHMSLIAIRAETAPYRLAGLSDPIAAEFGWLSSAAREAMTDMRRLLGVLRHDEPAGRAPQPHLGDLPTLVETAQRAGVPVELSMPASVDGVPAGVGVCAYRIVQESLSNASRHAQGAPVTVSVSNDDGAMVLRVTNACPGARRGSATSAGSGGGPATGAGSGRGPATGAGSGRGPATGAGSGHGLVGMHERVALLGGSLSAGPLPDGGFAVAAVLPLASTV